MGLFNNRSEGNYVKSYTIPSSCKDEKAHFDTSDNVQEKTETKPQPERKPRPKVEQKAEQKVTPNVNPSPRPRPNAGQGVPPFGRKPTSTPNAPQGKGCLNSGKIGCAIVIFIFFCVKKCVEEFASSFSYDSDNDVEVVYDTALYNFDEDSVEYDIEEEPLDSITFDDI